MSHFKKGDTALITGASSGIGKEFAFQLARLGVNLILMARRIELLETLKGEIEQNYKIKVSILQVDLSKANWKQSVHGIENLNVEFVINNAGTGYPFEFGTFDFTTDKELIQLNCITPLELTHLFLPKMKVKRHGGIIFVSSLMGMQGVPYMAQYSGTKGYLLNLGESLFTECKNYNVNIQVLLPGATKTPGANKYEIDYTKLPIKWMKTEEVVSFSLKKFGQKALVIPGRVNKISSFFNTCIYSRRRMQKIMHYYSKKVIQKRPNLIDKSTK